jgi:ABC-2 type transport system permease protein
MRHEFNVFWRTVLGRAYPRLIGIRREKSWMIFGVVLPLLGISAYVFIYKALKSPPEFVGFVILGGAMTAYWLNILWAMATQFYWEKETGNLQLYMIAPTSRMAILMGMAFGGLISTTIRAVIILMAGLFIFGVQYTVVSWWQLFLVFFLTMVALYGLGMLFSSLFMVFGREAWHVSSLLQEPIYLLSGFYFPIKSLGYWVSIGASIVPVTLGLDAMRQLLMPATPWGFLSVKVEIGILLALSVVFVFAAHRALLYMEDLARKEGRLTVRGQ